MVGIFCFHSLRGLKATKGSQFPTHRVFTKIGDSDWSLVKEQAQGHISELWTSSSINKVLVK